MKTDLRRLAGFVRSKAPQPAGEFVGPLLRGVGAAHGVAWPDASAAGNLLVRFEEGRLKPRNHGSREAKGLRLLTGVDPAKHWDGESPSAYADH
ncbi:MAG: hypothetical protein HKL95_10610 [Phycisphaerae bacterium]|nr:hypothetical protein [Phycisphaerae bacterium]